MASGFTAFLLLLVLLTLGVYSKSIVNTLPGFPGQFPFEFETGYVGIGEKEETQFFYYFVESEGNPEEDPLIFYLTGGPGCSAVLTFFNQIGPLSLNFGNGHGNTTLALNPSSWTKMANVIFLDMPAGTGFSYATTKEASISSDSIVAKQAHEFLRKFLIDHPKFLNNPLYISGISYMGIVAPVATLEMYNANERGDQPTLNIQGYILCSPLTDKFMDFNSRVEYAHRMALISDDIYESALENCHGDYMNTDTANSLCLNSLQRYKECTRGINIKNILDPLCDKKDLKPYCQEYYYDFIVAWANDKAVQQALNIRQGTIGKWQLFNRTLHYVEGKNDTACYSYDIFSSFAYHKKLVSKNCRALIFSGDHDMTFPYLGVEQWIVALNLGVDIPWKPFYVNDQVGGYETTYAQNDFSLTYATVKGAGHSVAQYKPEEARVLLEKWLGTKTYSSTIMSWHGRNADEPEITEVIRQSIADVIPDIVRQTTEEIRRIVHDTLNAGSGSSSGGVHVWLERFNMQRPRMFESAREPVDAENWIRHIEKIFNTLDCPEQFRVKLATYKFENDAQNWWDACMQSNPSVQEFTWVQFKEFFYNQYFTVSDRNAYSREFATICQQDGENIADYMNRFLRLAQFAGATTGTLADQTNRFKWTISDQYREDLVNIHFDSITQIVDAVKDLERSRSARQARLSESKKRSSDNSPHDYISQRSGCFEADDGSQKNSEDSKFRIPVSASKKKQCSAGSYARCKLCHKWHRPGPCLKMTGACYICRGQGHLAKACPNKRGR